MTERAVLVIGGDGLIGAALADRLRHDGVPVAATGRRAGAAIRLDLAKPETWPDLPEAEVAYICAAIATGAACDADPGTSGAVNARAPALLAERLAARGTHVVLLSTTQVVAGEVPFANEDAPPAPVSTYGRHKAEAEAAVLAQGGSIVRLTKVLAPGMPLLAGWAERLTAGEAVEAFSDMRLAPITVDYAVDLLLAVGGLRAGGVFHGSGDREVVYVDLARALAGALGVPNDLVTPTPAPDPGQPHPSLGMVRTTRLTGIAPQSTEAVLAETAQGAVAC